MDMFKKRVTAAQIAERRLAKAQAAHARAIQAQRAAFIANIVGHQPTAASMHEAQQLVERVRAAKNAPFLSQYRIAS